MPNAHGVVPGDDVRIAGVPVGRIMSIKLNGTTPILVVQIDSKYAPVYANARAQLRPNTPLEDMYLDIVSRGSRSAARLGARSILAAERTEAPVDIGVVLDVFNSDVRPHMATALTQLAAGLKDHGQQLEETLTDLAPVLRSVRGLTIEMSERQALTSALVHNLKVMTQTLARRDSQLTGLIHNAGATFQTVGANASSLEQLLPELSRTLLDLPPAFAEVRAASQALEPATTAMLPVAGALPDGLSALQRFATVEEPAAQALRTTVPGLTTLLSDTIPVSDNLVAAFPILRSDTPPLSRVMKAVVPCEPAVNDYFQSLSSATQFGDTISSYLRESSNVGIGSLGVADPFLTAGASCTGTALEK